VSASFGCFGRHTSNSIGEAATEVFFTCSANPIKMARRSTAVAVPVLCSSRVSSHSA
jgi:hypothetical protein